MEGKGIYFDGRSPEAIPCDIALAGNDLNIYLRRKKNELVIWNIKRLQSCTINSHTAILEYGPAPFQKIECAPPIGNIIQEIWKGKAVDDRKERKGKNPAAIVLSILLLIIVSFCLLTWFYF